MAAPELDAALMAKGVRLIAIEDAGTAIGWCGFEATRDRREVEAENAGGTAPRRSLRRLSRVPISDVVCHPCFLLELWPARKITVGVRNPPRGDRAIGPARKCWHYAPGGKDAARRSARRVLGPFDRLSPEVLRAARPRAPAATRRADIGL